MDYQYEATVVLLTYNPTEPELRRTLRSIAEQVDCRYQLLIVDDCSAEDPSALIASIAADVDAMPYGYIRHPQNMRTVHSVRRALEHVTGKYTKLLGAGDELYDQHTLRTIVDFCEEHGACCGFGDIVVLDSGKPLRFPSNADSYPPSGSASRQELFERQVRYADWIPGCSQFYATEFFTRMLEKLAIQYEVNFCEDFSETLALLETDVFHLTTPIVRYDWGGGISTSGSVAARKRLYDDHLHFFTHAREERPFGLSMLLPLQQFKVKRFIALKTPFYPLAQKIFARLHMDD